MKMRDIMGIIETMSRPEALNVFKQAGLDAEAMTPQQLKAARNKLAKARHSDLGGSDTEMSEVNDAYDTLKATFTDQTKAPPRSEFKMSSLLDDDEPNEVERISVQVCSTPPVISVIWHSWGRDISAEEARKVLALRSGRTIEVAETERVATPPHRARVSRSGDKLIYQFTHHRITREDGVEQTSTQWSAPTYAISIADLAAAYAVLKQAPERAKAIRAHNRSHPQGPFLAASEEITSRRASSASLNH